MRLRDRTEEREHFEAVSSGPHGASTQARGRGDPVRAWPLPQPCVGACHPHGLSQSRAHIQDTSSSFIRLLSKCVQFQVEK